MLWETLKFILYIKVFFISHSPQFIVNGVCSFSRHVCKALSLFLGAKAVLQISSEDKVY